jgi:hypothetical protein
MFIEKYLYGYKYSTTLFDHTYIKIYFLIIQQFSLYTYEKYVCADQTEELNYCDHLSLPGVYI